MESQDDRRARLDRANAKFIFRWDSSSANLGSIPERPSIKDGTSRRTTFTTCLVSSGLGPARCLTPPPLREPSVDRSRAVCEWTQSYGYMPCGQPVVETGILRDAGSVARTCVLDVSVAGCVTNQNGMTVRGLRTTSGVRVLIGAGLSVPDA